MNITFILTEQMKVPKVNILNVSNSHKCSEPFSAAVFDTNENQLVFGDL